MPLTSPGNDDDTGENHQPTLRKNTAEPVEQTLKQNTLLAGLRAFEVEIRTADGRHVNTLPRSYGDGGRTVRNPATLLPALARKPNAWGESPLRGELPDGLVLRLDALDPGSRRRELTLLHRAGVASGFGNAVLAMAAIVEGGRAPDEASLLALARRIAQGDPPDPDDGAGRLAVYDAFNLPRQGFPRL